MTAFARLKNEAVSCDASTIRIDTILWFLTVTFTVIVPPYPVPFPMYSPSLNSPVTDSNEDDICVAVVFSIGFSFAFTFILNRFGISFNTGLLLWIATATRNAIRNAGHILNNRLLF